jgi:hypothetical protein
MSIVFLTALIYLSIGLLFAKVNKNYFKSQWYGKESKFPVTLLLINLLLWPWFLIVAFFMLLADWL